MTSDLGSTSKRTIAVPIVVAIGVLGLAGAVVALVHRAESRTNKVALEDSAKPVSVIQAASATYRPMRVYVGTLRPWLEASVGPQLVAAYVDTVLVRPGAAVKRGQVLATMDCRNASAASQAIAAQARAIDARQKALAHESARVQSMLDGGFVSPNEAEQKSAQSAAEQAQLAAEQSKLVSKNIEVNDCVLRSPFDGEIASRMIDPGAFVRPGVPIVAVVDRTTVRLTADAPETDFDALAPGGKVRVRILSTGKKLTATISRRAPAADPGTRTVHFEIDLPNTDRDIPVNTTGEIEIEIGEPSPATEIPIYAATVRGTKAQLFVVDGDVAHARTVALKGETAGSLFLDPTLAAGTKVVTEGRALLKDGDRVSAKLESTEPAAAAAPAATPTPEPTPAAKAPEKRTAP